MATISEVVSYLENFAPLALQETYDNAGLITGEAATEVKGVLVCLDSIEEVLDEAIRKGCNLIVAHHPIVFSGLKKINGKNYVERILIKAIRNHIAIYATHTNLDNIKHGVNAKICEKLGLKNTKILLSKKNLLMKMVTFCPESHAEAVRSALFASGCGQISNYDECSFNIEGTGTFRAGENTNPFVGEKGKRHNEKETRIETIFESYKENKVILALKESHPYEEVAYDIYPLQNSLPEVGSGMIGDLGSPMEPMDFLKLVKTGMKTKCIRYTALPSKKISRIAVCGGSGGFLLNDAVRQDADAFITSDFKYHQFFDADKKIMLADIGHYESEQFTMELLHGLLVKKFSTFAVHLTEVETNPVNYF
jgi:dinuclear metal center YbgI/SA1388 family protein